MVTYDFYFPRNSIMKAKPKIPNLSSGSQLPLGLGGGGDVSTTSSLPQQD